MLAVGVVVAVGAPSAGAANLTVTTTSDEMNAGDGLCSLREAIAAVNSPSTPGNCGTAGFGANTIVLRGQKYVLSIHGAGADNATGDLNLAGTVSDLTITGAGVAKTKVDATGLGDRVLSVPSAASVTVTKLTLTGGHAPDGAPGANGGNDLASNNEGCGGDCGGDGGQGGAGASGGGVNNAGLLILRDAAVTNSSAGSGGAGGTGGFGDQGGVGGAGGRAGAGGGIYNAGTLRLVRTTISGNKGGAGGDGGSAGITYNTAGVIGGDGSGFGDGGGVYNDAGTLTITGSTIVRNLAGKGGNGGTGGETHYHSTAGTGGNGGTASWGGGVVSIGGSLSVTNSTVAANHGGDGGVGGTGGTVGGGANPATGGDGGTGGGGGDGGGLVTYGSNALLRNVTFAGNTVGSAGLGGSGGSGPSPGSHGDSGPTPAGGGIYVAVVFCVIGHPCPVTTLRNTIVAANGGGNCSGSIGDGGYNLSFGDTSCPGINADPKLGSLGNHGGRTATISLLAGSKAIDQVPIGSGCPAIDQRGVKRPQGPNCDIGAYELATPSIVISSPRSSARYKRGSRVRAAFKCSEGGITSPIATCKGTVAKGRPINTSTLGTKSFTVTATDRSGHRTSKTVHYTVTR